MMFRSPAVAGQFYPADPQELRAQIGSFLDFAAYHGPAPKALIVPHAGTIYSGSIAGKAYSALGVLQGQIRRVVLLGPAHYVAFQGLAMSSAEAFATPLGEIPLDREALLQLQTLPQVITYDEAHRPEHSLELQLPFLQEVLQDYQLVPLLVGPSKLEAVAEVLTKLWGGAETLILISSDLSHYLDYESAQAIDRRTSESILALDEASLQHDSACGFYPLRGFLRTAKQHHLKGECLDLKNSGDTSGMKGRVVGYGAYAFCEA